jgi:hypothetical protein
MEARSTSAVPDANRPSTGSLRDTRSQCPADDFSQFSSDWVDSGRAELLRETMSSLEQRLDAAEFLRIHRSRIVRTSSILELRSIENREFTVRLSDGSEHRSSRTYADRLEHWLLSEKG